MEGEYVGLRACLFSDRICEKRRNNKGKDQGNGKDGNKTRQARLAVAWGH